MLCFLQVVENVSKMQTEVKFTSKRTTIVAIEALSCSLKDSLNYKACTSVQIQSTSNRPVTSQNSHLLQFQILKTSTLSSDLNHDKHFWDFSVCKKFKKDDFQQLNVLPQNLIPSPLNRHGKKHRSILLGYYCDSCCHRQMQSISSDLQYSTTLISCNNFVKLESPNYPHLNLHRKFWGLYIYLQEFQEGRLPNSSTLHKSSFQALLLQKTPTILLKWFSGDHS